jgi:hypothetical protein
MWLIWTQQPAEENEDEHRFLAICQSRGDPLHPLATNILDKIAIV